MQPIFGNPINGNPVKNDPSFRVVATSLSPGGPGYVQYDKYIWTNGKEFVTVYDYWNKGRVVSYYIDRVTASIEFSDMAHKECSPKDAGLIEIIID